MVRPAPLHDPHCDSHQIPFAGLFGFAATFTVASLYYPQPILIQLAEDFGVSYEEVTNIPTLLQAGYAVGLLLICPLGDLIRRRQLLLLLVACGGVLSL
jgi:predicted MFS family arabinose efflux permease